jgi:hypothetical protein
MKGNSVVLLVVGLIILYMAVTGKLDCFAGAFACLFGTAPATTTPDGNSPIVPPVTQSGSVRDLPKVDFSNLGSVLTPPTLG